MENTQLSATHNAAHEHQHAWVRFECTAYAAWGPRRAPGTRTADADGLMLLLFRSRARPCTTADGCTQARAELSKDRPRVAVMLY